MPSNQQRREAAKRKLERQLVRRQERARSRRQRFLIVGVVAAVLVVGGVVWFVTTRKPSTAADPATDTSTSDTAATSSSAPTTPCSYTTTDVAKTVKPAAPPSNLSPANKGTIDVQITMNGQPVPVTLDRAAAPCTVNSFVSLASQGFYNSTDCWRLTASSALNILQCGDPSGKGNGGPGYTFADELKTTAKYTAGTVAMANSGADTNGSQFFIVYKDSTLPASYTVFGKVSADGMKVIDAIAAKGVSKGAQDGAPVQKATISTVTVPDGAVSATGSYPSTAASSAASSAADTVAPSSADDTVAPSSADSAVAPSSADAGTSSGAVSTAASTAVSSSNN